MEYEKARVVMGEDLRFVKEAWVANVIEEINMEEYEDGKDSDDEIILFQQAVEFEEDQGKARKQSPRSVSRRLCPKDENNKMLNKLLKNINSRNKHVEQCRTENNIVQH